MIRLWNLALLRIGDKTVASPEEPSREAKLCASIWEHCRDTVLQSFAWPFARRRVVLAPLPSSVTNWAYAYVYPTDCLRALAIVTPGARLVRSDQFTPFEVGRDASGTRVIYSDMPAAELEYCARVDDVTQWTPLAQDALAWLMAAELSIPITGKADKETRARQAFNLALSAAATASAQEGWRGPEPMGEFLAARGVNL